MLCGRFYMPLLLVTVARGSKVLETARRSGKQLGRPRGRCITEKERKAKNIILKRDTLFGGDLCPSDCMKVIGISRGTYYKYRNDLSKFPIA